MRLSHYKIQEFYQYLSQEKLRI